MLQSFNKQSREEWIEKAQKELKGKIDVRSLAYQVDNLKISPFLTSDNGAKSYSHGKNSIPKVTAWVDTRESTSIITALENGVNALYCELYNQSEIKEMMDGVIPDIIDWIIVDHSNGRIKSKELLEHIGSNTPIIMLSDEIPRLTYEMAIADRLQKISTSDKIIVLETKNDFLAQIAELRAINYNMDTTTICLQPLQALDTNDKQSLISINYMMMSAFLGGADYIVSLPYGQNNDNMARLSTNIMHILIYEVGLNQVNDATNGSYMVESLTEEFLKMMS